MSKLTKKEARHRRHRRVRGRISGTAARPRMSVCTTANHIYVQFIDDEAGTTLASASTMDKAFKEGENKCNVEGAKVLGQMATTKAKAVGIEIVVFDRGGFRYQGRVKAIAEASREAGLKL